MVSGQKRLFHGRAFGHSNVSLSQISCAHNRDDLTPSDRRSSEAATIRPDCFWHWLLLAGNWGRAGGSADFAGARRPGLLAPTLPLSLLRPKPLDISVDLTDQPPNDVRPS